MMKQPAMKIDPRSPTSGGRRPRRLTPRALERMRLPRRFWDASFKRISEGVHKEAIERFARKIVPALKKGYGMILWGNNGVGKTAAAAACLKQARLHGATGMFITTNQFIMDTIARTPFDDAHSVHQRAKSVDLLVIDDLGKESVDLSASKDTVEAMLEDLLRSRSAEMKSTIITSNLAPETMEAKFGQSLMRVMQEANPLIEMRGPSKRNEGQRELVRFFNE